MENLKRLSVKMTFKTVMRSILWQGSPLLIGRINTTHALLTCFFFGPFVFGQTNIFKFYVCSSEGKSAEFSSTANIEVIQLVARHFRRWKFAVRGDRERNLYICSPVWSGLMRIGNVTQSNTWLSFAAVVTHPTPRNLLGKSPGNEVDTCPTFVTSRKW